VETYLRGICYILFLNAGAFATYATSTDQMGASNQPTKSEVAAMFPTDQYVYYGFEDLRRMRHQEARDNFKKALAINPDHFRANSGLDSALLDLVKKDRGWKNELEAQTKKLDELRAVEAIDK
jgi:Tfp pilus assembly protein PilF